MDKLPPSSIEAEEAILGGIIFDPKALGRICNQLPVQAFFVRKHQIIYQACLLLKETDKKTDFITLVDWFSSRQLLEEIGGTTYLAQLLNHTLSSTNIDRYADLVLDKYRRRELIKLGHEIIELGYNPSLELEEIYQQIKGQLPNEENDTNAPTINPTISKLRYTITNPLDRNAILELEAEVTDQKYLEKKITSLWLKTEAICKRIWNQDKKNPLEQEPEEN